MNDNSFYTVSHISPALYEDMPRISIALFSGEELLLSPNMPAETMEIHVRRFLLPHFLTAGEGVLTAVASTVLANVSKAALAESLP